MATVLFDRDSMAAWYASEHLKTDPGITAVYHLPEGSDDREIRLVEINRLIGERNDTGMEPIDFGIDFGTETQHKLLVLDVTPEQWKRIQSRELSLPPGWSVEGLKAYRKR